MIIKNLEVKHETIPLKVPFKTALRTATEIESVEVIITLENGITGRGAAAPTYVITGDSLESILAALKGPIKAAIIGRDVKEFQLLLQSVQSCCVGNTSAKAAADIALHDAYSRLIEVPLHTYLGGKKTLSTCMTIGVDTPEKMTKAAKSAVADGFQVLKIKVGANPELDIERIQKIHEAIPSYIKLRLDANQGWRAKQAVQIIHEMESRNFNIEFIEQPVPSYDLDGLKFVTNRVSTLIMADESLFSVKDALKLVAGRYVDLLNIKLMKCGGINEAWKIASIAEANGVGCMIGSMMEPCFSVGAAAHFAAAHPNVHYFDLDAPLWLDGDLDVLTYHGDQVILSALPGVGDVQTTFQGIKKDAT
ncbi:dipeptide epimerase [Priestia flexa]|uniref:dipeptide epimerase n=1 Tax=Priestia flexa TaxID=86664 RepID=UPI00077C4597|nr:dipeptide epimerase [Priestia flexa]AQX54352.1 dipeptide epimerase [Priestia flexa]MCA1203345.1 dipeptide epimerase [Priestia flexa]MCG7313366.1 dipeptide epimerase [Priestia flexa]MCP1189934.1 dipeptide epimerase [Priestia flexa]MED4589016.1 dipeptide epimerase [Priestia flexa]